jgi:exopolysaccharide biosynthesis protein
MENKEKFSLIIFFCCLLITKSMAQEPFVDSIAFEKVSWTLTPLSRNLTWEQFHFSSKQLFNANENINILRWKNGKRKNTLSFASGGDSLFLTSTLAQKAGAKVAVNGSFFDVKNGGAVDFIKIDGRVLDTTVLPRGRRAEHQLAALAIRKNRMYILKGDSTDLKWDEKLDFDHVMVTGPLLIFEGKKQPLSNSAFSNNRHPRTCACITAKNDLILMTVDGRTAESQGVSLAEATRLLQWLGCHSAVNLDGGGSTTFYVAGQPENGVVNMPCDNKKFDHAGERKVSNIIFLK